MRATTRCMAEIYRTVAFLPLARGPPARDHRRMNVEILLFDGFDELDALGPWEVFAGVAAVRDDVTASLVTLEGAREVRADHGLVVHGAGRAVRAPRPPARPRRRLVRPHAGRRLGAGAARRAPRRDRRAPRRGQRRRLGLHGRAAARRGRRARRPPRDDEPGRAGRPARARRRRGGRGARRRRRRRDHRRRARRAGSTSRCTCSSGSAARGSRTPPPASSGTSAPPAAC